MAEHKTEPNSGLGKAISYLLNHWTKLTLFVTTLLASDAGGRKSSGRACTPLLFLRAISRRWSTNRTMQEYVTRRRPCQVGKVNSVAASGQAREKTTGAARRRFRKLVRSAV